MKSFYRDNKQVIIGVLAGVLLVYLTAGLVVSNKLSSLENYLDTKISDQETKLNQLAAIAGRGGSNEFTENYVKDCPAEERKKFDNLLSSLDTELSFADLRELDNLFVFCGSVYADRRASMVAQLKQEVEVLDVYVTERELLDDDYKENSPIPKWNELLAGEEEIKDLFYEQVGIQNEIIKMLLSGKAVNSSKVTELQDKAGQVQGKLSSATEKTSGLRSELSL